MSKFLLNVDIRTNALSFFRSKNPHPEVQSIL